MKLRPNEIVTWFGHRLRWRGVLVLAAAVVLVVLLFGRSGHDAAGMATFAAGRGPLEITVLEGGTVQALQSQEIKCEVRVGYQGTKILRIVEEGYEVTEEDIRTNKVLVELDSSELQKQIAQQEIQYQSARANLTEARQNYEIQLNQNASDIKAAEQKVRFARMDFDKLLGDAVAAQIVRELGLDTLVALASTNNVTPLSTADTATLQIEQPVSSSNPGTGSVANTAVGPVLVSAAVPSGANPGVGAPGAPQSPDGTNQFVLPEEATFQLPSTAAVDFTKYASTDVLGDGEAKQRLRRLEDDLQVAKKELGQAESTLAGTRRLFEKGFVTKIDLEREEIAYENSRLKVQTAETARELYLKYDFPKAAEEALSKYLDAVRDLDKTRRLAISKLAQAGARLHSAQAQYNIQARQLKELYEQLAKCTIVATKPGLVVYGGARDGMYYYGGDERIREGATVRERQTIITIPDLSSMTVRVKIHENHIKKVKKGQKARITVDAFPDRMLEGEVSKVAVLPDSQDRWLNPDMSVYLTTVNINGAHTWLKPGMSAKVEIFVERLPDVVYVPLQAVLPHGDKHVCYVVRGRKYERRFVEIGEYNDEFIEIKSGLKEGEMVLLRPIETPAPEKIDCPPKGDEPGRSDTKAGLATSPG